MNSGVKYLKLLRCLALLLNTLESTFKKENYLVDSHIPNLIFLWGGGGNNKREDTEEVPGSFSFLSSTQGQAVPSRGEPWIS